MRYYVPDSPPLTERRRVPLFAGEPAQETDEVSALSSDELSDTYLGSLLLPLRG